MHKRERGCTVKQRDNAKERKRGGILKQRENAQERKRGQTLSFFSSLSTSTILPELCTIVCSEGELPSSARWSFIMASSQPATIAKARIEREIDRASGGFWAGERKLHDNACVCICVRRAGSGLFSAVHGVIVHPMSGVHEALT